MAQSSYLPREVQTGTSADVFVTHVEDPDTFYCQLAEDTEAIEEMAAILSSTFGQKSTAPSLTDATLGQACVAQYSVDSNWYRAEIIGVLQSGLREVRFVDYGNTEEVLASTLKILPQSLLHKPLLSVRCSLDSVVNQGTYWSIEEIDIFKQLTGDGGSFVAKFNKMRDTGQYMVDLMDEQRRDVCKAFCQAARVTYLGSDSLPMKGRGEPETLVTTGFSMGQTDRGTIVYVKSPDEFWFVPKELQTRLETVMECLAKEYTDIGPYDRILSKLTPGMRCAAKFPVDEAWYRGVIKSADMEKCEVEFLDYGNTDPVPLQDIRELTPELLDIPPLAVKCGLSNAFPISGKWKDKECYAFETMAADQEVEILIREVRPTMYLVRATIVSTGADLGEQLVKDGLANARRGAALAGSRSATPSCPKASVPLQKKELVYLSHVESPEKFWVQLDRDVEKMEELDNQLQAFCRGPEGKKLAVLRDNLGEGKTLMAKFSQDEKWYRAVIEKVVGDHVHVHFVDYGNTDKLPLSHLQEIASSFLQQPAFALKCTLKSSHGWKADDGQRLEQLTEDGAFCSFLSTQGDTCMVTLEVKGQDVATLLQGAGVASSPFPQPPKLGQRPEKIFLSHVESPWSFWCQLSKYHRGIEALAETLAAFYTSGTMKNLVSMKSGDPCVALYPLDECYYRAVVQDVQGQTVTVHFVDYGNTEQVGKELVYEILPQLLGEPVMSLHCRLDMPLMKDADNALTEAFQNLAPEKELTLQAVSEEKDCYNVNLFDGDQSFSAALQALASGSQRLGAGDAPITFRSSSQATTYPLASLPQGRFTCYLTFLVSGEEIYVQLSGIEEELSRLNAALAATYGDGSQPPLLNPRPGLPCCLYYAEDSSWYRGRVAEVLGDQLEVQIVDYGNCITVPAQEVKPLAEEFVSAPYARVCSLGQPDLDKDKLEAMLADGEISCQVISGKKVKMSVGGEDVLYLLQKSQIVPPEARFTLPELPSGEVQCAISHIDDSGEFCLQLMSRADDIMELQGQLQISYTTCPPVTLETLEVGGVSCVMFTMDESWYRARIDKVDGGKVTVTYVDFGNSDVIPKSSVKGLLSKFLPPPCFAYRCRLAKAPKWKPSVKQRLEVIAEGEISVQFQSDTPPYEVVARTSKGLVSDLIRDVLPKQYSQRAAPRDSVNGMVTAIEEDGLFYVQLVHEENNLNGLAGAVQELYASFDTLDTEEKVTFEPGNVCVAKFSEDGNYYRARIKSVSGDQVCVLFVDYGNSENVSRSDIRPHVEEEYLKVAPYAFECRLQGATVWNAEYHKKFAAFTENKLVSVRFLSKSPPFTVDITKSMLDILNEPTPVLSPPGAQAWAVQPAPVTEVKKVAYPEQPTLEAGDCYLSEVRSDGSFFLQLAGDGERLEALSAQLAALELAPDCSAVLPPSLLGYALGAKFSEDDCWYRCTVTGEDPASNTCTVLFVDYGNVDEGLARSRLKPLAEDTLALAPLAYRCCLEGKGLLSAEEGAKFKELCEDQVLQLKSAAKTEAGHFSVVLELDGVDAVKAAFGEEPLAEDATTSVPAADAQEAQDTNNSAVVSHPQENALPAEEMKAPVLESEVTGTGATTQESRDGNLQDAVAGTPLAASPTLTPGHRVAASVTHVETPSYFFVSPDASRKTYDALMESLLEQGEALPEAEAVEVGSCAAAPFGEDGSWYRVRVEELDGDSCTVTYVDHGNTEEVASGDLRGLPEDWSLEAVPALASPCCLAGVAPREEDWSEEECAAFSELVNEKQVLVEVLSKDDSDCFLVNLLHMGNDVGSQLVAQSLAKAAPLAAGNPAVRQVFSDSSLDTTNPTSRDDNEDSLFMDAEEGEGASDAETQDADADVGRDATKEALEADGGGDVEQEQQPAQAAEQEDGGQRQGEEEQTEAEEEREVEDDGEVEVEEEEEAEASGVKAEDGAEAEEVPAEEADQQEHEPDKSDQSQSVSTKAIVENLDSAGAVVPAQERAAGEANGVGGQAVEETSPASVGSTLTASASQTTGPSILNQALTESGMIAAVERQEQKREERLEQGEGEKPLLEKEEEEEEEETERVREAEELGDGWQLDSTPVASADSAASLNQAVPELGISFQQPLMESTIAGDRDRDVEPDATSQMRTEARDDDQTSGMDLLQVPQEELKEDKGAFESYSKFKPLDDQEGSARVKNGTLVPAADWNQSESNGLHSFSPRDDPYADVGPGADEADLPEDLSLYKSYDVVITDIESATPSLFYAMLTANISNYGLLRHNIQECMKREEFPEDWHPTLSMTCLVLRDGEWLRGDVIAMEKDEFQVRFVDVGGEVTVGRGDMRPLPTSLGVLKPFGIWCCLSKISLCNSWSPEALDFFVAYLRSDHLAIYVESYEAGDGLYAVELARAGQPTEPSLNDLMRTKGFASPLHCIELEGEQDELEKSFLEVSQHRLDSLGLSDEESESDCQEGGGSAPADPGLQSPGRPAAPPTAGEGQTAAPPTPDSDCTTPSAALDNPQPQPEACPCIPDVIISSLGTGGSLQSALPKDGDEDGLVREGGMECPAGTAGVGLRESLECERQAVAGEEDGQGLVDGGPLRESQASNGGLSVGNQKGSGPAASQPGVVAAEEEGRSSSPTHSSSVKNGSSRVELAEAPFGSISEAVPLKEEAVDAGSGATAAAAADEDEEGELREVYYSPLDSSPQDSDDPSSPANPAFLDSVTG